MNRQMALLQVGCSECGPRIMNDFVYVFLRLAGRSFVRDVATCNTKFKLISNGNKMSWSDDHKQQRHDVMSLVARTDDNRCNEFGSRARVV